jgi:Putative auto-transporter adhesin, head GIN domain
MKISPLSLIPIAALALSACSFSAGAEDKRLTSDGKQISTSAATTGSFTRIEGVGPDNIVFVTGDSFSIKAEGDAEAIKTLRYAMDNGTIIIGREKGDWWGKDSKAVTITVTAPSLSAASLTGSGDFTADQMSNDTVELEIAGSGDLTVGKVTAKELKSSLAGSGDIKFSGAATKAAYEIAGSGNVDAAGLVATDAEVSIAGSGDVKLNASGKVDASIAGSGSITVLGGAKCTSSVMGSGKLNCG